jgi:hypothetical protein
MLDEGRTGQRSTISSWPCPPALTPERLLARADSDRGGDRRRAQRRGRGRSLQPADHRRELAAREANWLRAWFRYLRQAGLNFSACPPWSMRCRMRRMVARGLIALFLCRHDPAFAGDRAAAEEAGRRRRSATACRRWRDQRRPPAAPVPRAWWKRCCAPMPLPPPAPTALAFKLDSALIPGLPKPVPWREIFVYSRRVEGIHLRAGPVARGGLRWSDRRDDFRTEVLGPDEGPAGQERGDRADRRQGRLLSQAACPIPRWTAKAGWPRARKATSFSSASLLSITDNIVEGKDRPPCWRGDARRRRSLLRRRRRQGHRDLSPTPPMRWRGTRLLAGRCLRQRRLQGLRPQGHGHHRARCLAIGATPFPGTGRGRPDPTGARGRLRRHVGRRVRQRHAAVARRSSWSPPSTTATCSSIPIPTRRRAGRSGRGCSPCRAPAGTITTRR